jgi:hypothetical protein
MKILGILLLVVGIAGLAYGGFSWTRQKTVVDAGPIKIQRDEHEKVPIPPIVGGVCLVAGVVLIMSRGR